MKEHPESIDPFDRGSASLFVRVEHLARYEYAAEFIRKRKLRHALDCACGSGYGSLVLARHAQTVDAVDRDEALLDLGRTRCEAAVASNVSFHKADLNVRLPFLPDNSMDCVTCFETLEHVERDEQLLKELARVLRRSRWLILSVPKAGYEPASPSGVPENPWHLRLYATDGLRALAERCGFAVEQVLGQPYTNMMRAQAESWRRDTGATAEEISSYFSETPESMRLFSRLWGWPTGEAPEKSSVLLFICRKL